MLCSLFPSTKKPFSFPSSCLLGPVRYFRIVLLKLQTFGDLRSSIHSHLTYDQTTHSVEPAPTYFSVLLHWHVVYLHKCSICPDKTKKVNYALSWSIAKNRSRSNWQIVWVLYTLAGFYANLLWKSPESSPWQRLWICLSLNSYCLVFVNSEVLLLMHKRPEMGGNLAFVFNKVLNILQTFTS